MEILMLLRELKMRKIRELLAKSLFRLASTDYQIHYIDNSTIYEYVAPEDLIEEVANFCREAQLDCFKNNFSERELDLQIYCKIKYSTCQMVIYTEQLYGLD